MQSAEKSDYASYAQALFSVSLKILAVRKHACEFLPRTEKNHLTKLTYHYRVNTPLTGECSFCCINCCIKNEKPKTSGNCLCFRSLFIFNCQKQSLRTLDLAGAQASGANVHMTRSSLHNRFYTLYVRLPCSVRPSVGVRNLDTEGNTLSANFTFSHSTAPPYPNIACRLPENRLLRQSAN